jgi:two-component system response regulator EvgA
MNKVLIVDDHPVIRLAVRMLMERHGYEVIAETDNGVDALQMAREYAPDIGRLQELSATRLLN